MPYCFDEDDIDAIFGLSYTYIIYNIDLYCIYNRGCCTYCGWILDVVTQLEYILFKVIAVDAWSCNNSAGRNRNFQKRGRSTSGCIHGLYLRTSQAWMQMHASTWFTFIWVFSTEAAAQRRLGVSLQEKDIDKQQQQACSEIWHGHCSGSSSDLCWSQSQIRQRNDDHQKAGPKNAAIRSVQPVLHDSVGNWRRKHDVLAVRPWHSSLPGNKMKSFQFLQHSWPISSGLEIGGNCQLYRTCTLQHGILYCMYF